MINVNTDASINNNMEIASINTNVKMVMLSVASRWLQITGILTIAQASINTNLKMGQL